MRAVGPWVRDVEAAAAAAEGRYRLRGAVRPFLHEAALVIAGGLLYYLVRGAVVDRVEEARQRAGALMDLERSLGLFWEPTLQAWALSSRVLVDLMNGIYFWAHMPVIVVIALWLYGRRRPLYRRIRNAFIASALIGLALYFLVPTAPPRLFPDLGFVDTLAQSGGVSYAAQEVGAFVNPYAALPSLHFGWALLLALALWWGRPRRGWGRAGCCAAALVLAPAQFLAIVMTGNHFVLDAVAGAAVALIALAAALAWERRRRPGAGRASRGAVNETA